VIIAVTQPIVKAEAQSPSGVFGLRTIKKTQGQRRKIPFVSLVVHYQKTQG